MYRAYNLEKFLKTPAKIYFKNEGVSPAGSHKPNTSVPQAYYNKVRGRRGSPPRPERAVGQCPFHGLCIFRPGMQGLHGQDQLQPEALPSADDGDLGANCVASPSTETKAGQSILAQNPDSPEAWASPSVRPSNPLSRKGQQVFPGQCVEPRDAPSDRHRSGVPEATGDCRRLPGCDHRVLRRGSNLRVRFPFVRDKINARRSTSLPLNPCPARP